ncbi:hypothetical protein HYV83_05155 [Candidatus Woesearchaeota archaeon]|nr:hypothetical protein [Candidatus Woesearchaeota archaeon]
MNTALEEIKQAENDAERLVEDSGKRKESIIAEGRVKAAQFLKEKEEGLAREKAEALEHQKEKALAAREKVLAEGRDKLKSLRKSAEKQADGAVELVMDAFEKEIVKF